jgi:hypothetical protein
MSKFKHLERFQAPADKTIPYDLIQIEGDAVLHVVQATDANEKYWNAILRRNSASVRRLRSGRLNAAVLDSTRDHDRELFAKLIVKGWENVEDDQGNPVPFSQEDCLGFLQALPNWIFDDLRNFASDAQNFLEDGGADEVATSGN